MTTEASPTIVLPYVYQPVNLRGERVAMYLLCAAFTFIALVFGVMGYLTLDRSGHWLRYLVPTLMLAGWWVAVWLVMYNYRRNAGTWRIESDRLERSLDGTEAAIDFAEVTCLRVRPKSVVLDAVGTPGLVVPKAAAAALPHTRLVDCLVANIDQDIRAAGHWRVRTRPWLGVLYVTGGLALLGVTFSSLFHIGHVGHAFAMIASGRKFFGRGLVLTAGGIKTSLYDFSTIPWSDVERAEIGPAGLAISAIGRAPLRVAPYADNYLPLVAYVNRRLSEPGEAVISADLWLAFEE
jgi:hypothetical protein